VRYSLALCLAQTICRSSNLKDVLFKEGVLIKTASAPPWHGDLPISRGQCSATLKVARAPRLPTERHFSRRIWLGSHLSRGPDKHPRGLHSRRSWWPIDPSAACVQPWSQRSRVPVSSASACLPFAL